LTTMGFFGNSSSSNDLLRSKGGGLRLIAAAEVSNVFKSITEAACVEFLPTLCQILICQFD